MRRVRARAWACTLAAALLRPARVRDVRQCSSASGGPLWVYFDLDETLAHTRRSVPRPLVHLRRGAACAPTSIALHEWVSERRWQFDASDERMLDCLLRVLNHDNTRVLTVHEARALALAQWRTAMHDAESVCAAGDDDDDDDDAHSPAHADVLPRACVRQSAAQRVAYQLVWLLHADDDVELPPPDTRFVDATGAERLVYVRSHARTLFEALYDMRGAVSAGVFTAGRKDYADGILSSLPSPAERVLSLSASGVDGSAAAIEPAPRIGRTGVFAASAALLYRDQVALDDSKDLRRTGQPLERTLLVDNAPYALAAQPENGVLVSAFWGFNHDDELLRVLRVVRECAELVRERRDIRPLLLHERRATDTHTHAHAHGLARLVRDRCALMMTGRTYPPLYRDELARVFHA